MSNFRRWIDGRWKLEIDLRRRVFDWEIDIWDEFRDTIDRIILVEGTKDRVVWTLLPSEWFSLISFRRSLAR